MIKVYEFKGNIVVDRVLFDSNNPSKHHTHYDTIYALDASEYPVVNKLGIPIGVPSVLRHLDGQTKSTSSRPIHPNDDGTGSHSNSEGFKLDDLLVRRDPLPALKRPITHDSVTTHADMETAQNLSNRQSKKAKGSEGAPPSARMTRKSARIMAALTQTDIDDENQAWGETFLDHIVLWLATDLSISANLSIEPLTHHEAMRRPDAEKWRKAEDDHFRSMNEAGFAEVVDESVATNAGKTILPCKWNYKVKYPDEQDELYKARLVIRGDYQKPGIDYEETFSPVARMESVRLFLALTILWKLKPIQGDIPAAYINADLEEDVFMRGIPGKELPKGKIYRLLKSLWGLKQSGRNWYRLFIAAILEIDDIVQIVEDNCLFILRRQNGDLVLIAIYVDDIFLATSSDELETLIIEHLTKRFGFTVLGLPKRLLGLTLEWGRDPDVPINARYYSWVKVSIPTAINKLVKLLDLDNAKDKLIPANPDIRLSKDDSPTLEQLSGETREMQSIYRTIVGSCIWLQTTCRPDISYALIQLSSHMANPGYTHMKAATWIVQYLKGTANWGVKYTSTGNKHFEGYVDSDYGIDRNVFMYLFFLSGGPISWKAAFSSVSTSTCEAELRGVHGAKEAIKQLIWLTKLCHEVGLDLLEINGKRTMPLIIHEDNEAMISYAMNGNRHTLMRHLERDLSWIREAVNKQLVTFSHTKTAEMWSDIGTKPLTVSPFQYIRQNIMVP